MAISLTWPITSDGAGAVQYTANDWRTLLTNLFSEGILGPDSFEVTERALGANMTLDIAAGVGILTGDDAAGQGSYLVEATESLSAVTIGTANGSNPRIDLVGIQLRDPSEGGSAGRDCIFSVVAGTAAASPTEPSVPSSFLVLAEVLVPASATSIEDDDITDRRALSRLAHEVVSTSSIADGAVTTDKDGGIGSSSSSVDGVMRRASGGTGIADAGIVAGTSAVNRNYVDGKFPVGSTQIAAGAVTPTKISTTWATTGGLHYVKLGDIVFVQGNSDDTGTLPAGFRPAASVALQNSVGGTVLIPISGNVNGSGYVSGCYPVGYP